MFRYQYWKVLIVVIGFLVLVSLAVRVSQHPHTDEDDSHTSYGYRKYLQKQKQPQYKQRQQKQQQQESQQEPQPQQQQQQQQQQQPSDNPTESTQPLLYRARSPTIPEKIRSLFNTPGSEWSLILIILLFIYGAIPIYKLFKNRQTSAASTSSTTSSDSKISSSSNDDNVSTTTLNPEHSPSILTPFDEEDFMDLPPSTTTTTTTTSATSTNTIPSSLLSSKKPKNPRVAKLSTEDFVHISESDPDEPDSVCSTPSLIARQQRTSSTTSIISTPSTPLPSTPTRLSLIPATPQALTPFTDQNHRQLKTELELKRLEIEQQRLELQHAELQHRQQEQDKQREQAAKQKNNDILNSHWERLAGYVMVLYALSYSIAVLRSKLTLAKALDHLFGAELLSLVGMPTEWSIFSIAQLLLELLLHGSNWLWMMVSGLIGLLLMIGLIYVVSQVAGNLSFVVAMLSIVWWMSDATLASIMGAILCIIAVMGGLALLVWTYYYVCVSKSQWDLTDMKYRLWLWAPYPIFMLFALSFGWVTGGGPFLNVISQLFTAEKIITPPPILL